MKRALSALLFALLLPLMALAGGEAEWAAHLRKLSIENGSEDNKGLGGALEQFADLDSPQVVGLLPTYDLVAQIAEAYPEKKDVIFNLIFRHFDLWLYRHPTAEVEPAEMKTLLGLALRFEKKVVPPAKAEAEENLDSAFTTAMKIALQRSLRLSVESASEIPDILDADLPRSVAGAKFRRELCVVSIDRFVGLSPSLVDLRRMIGHVGMGPDAVTHRGEFMAGLRSTGLQVMADSRVRAQRRLAKSVDESSWNEEGEILLLVLLSQMIFKSEDEMNRAFEDAASLFESATVNLGLIHGRAILLHYLHFLKQGGAGKYSNATALKLFDYPGLLFKRWYLGNGQPPFGGEEYALDPSQRWGGRYRVAPQIEVNALARLNKVTQISEALDRQVGLLQFSPFPSLDMEEAKWNVMIGFIPRFMELKPEYRDLMNFLALVPRADTASISKIWELEKDSKDSTAVRFSRSLIALQKDTQITTDKPDEPLHRESIFVMGRLLLLQSLRGGEKFSDDLPTLLQLALGDDFWKVKKTSDQFIYRDIWSARGMGKIIALAKACGLASTRYPYPPLD